jgi:predicted nucleic acid-binding protein
LRALVEDDRVVLVGPVRQEVLSGLKDEALFERLRKRLKAYDYMPLVREDFETAARIHNQCRRRGICGSAVDFLLCAIAHRAEIAIFTTDRDFARYSAVVPIHLHETGIRQASGFWWHGHVEYNEGGPCDQVHEARIERDGSGSLVRIHCSRIKDAYGEYSLTAGVQEGRGTFVGRWGYLPLATDGGAVNLELRQDDPDLIVFTGRDYSEDGSEPNDFELTLLPAMDRRKTPG